MNRSNSLSGSSSRRTWKYEVFLSFRGEDTRNNFTGHLFAALRRKGIFTFKDDLRLEKGDSISVELVKAIEQSRICIVVFSENYANSSWCLRELAKISEGIGQQDYSILPIFYKVDPSDVKKQSGGYEKHFNEHEEKFRPNLGEVQKWKTAMNEVASLVGWDVGKRPEAEVIDEIVQDVINKLGHKFSAFADDLVGMPSRAEALENLLDLDSEDVVRVVGICGMGGVGKTTLAAVVFDRIAHKFGPCCFLQDVSKIYKESGGLIRLQKQLLRETLNENPEIGSDHTGTNILSTRFRHLKTLIVVDNVDHADQLQKLVGKSGWFGKGSRIIITTRDTHILTEHGVKDDEVYEAKTLSGDEAFQLLCRKAFKSDDPLSDFKELTLGVLQYAKALPLAIRVLGSLLCGRDKEKWNSALKRLKENPHQEIMGVLQTSYDGLEVEEEKEIFVDIACFFKGADEKYAKEILDHCGFNPEIGIGVLCDKSLINIVNGTLWMHDLLQELGWKIARANFPQEPAKWSRLWLHEDLRAINTGTEHAKAIVLNQEDHHETPLKAEALSQMSGLRMLILPSVQFSGNLNNLSNELRFLSWHKFPFSYLPSSFEPARLVELIMPDSNIKQLWDDSQSIKRLPKLRVINLRGSKNLIKTPNFSGMRDLERIDLQGCTGLLQVDSSIEVPTKLTFLNLRNCENLISIPKCLFLMSSLETLNLSGCSRLARRLNFEGPR